MARNLNPARFERIWKEQGIEKARLVQEMARWVGSLVPRWQVIAHETFTWEASIDSAQRIFEKHMRRLHPDVDYFYALEQNPGRPGFHIHSLQHRPQWPYLKEWWAEWFAKYGRCRFEFVHSMNDVEDYCAKYVCKERSWWNVHLITNPGTVTENGLTLSPVGFGVVEPDASEWGNPIRNVSQGGGGGGQICESSN